MAELLAAAHARLATDGAGGLSLRAIARDLGMASSAVYRYVASRDALLTLLIIEGYDAVGAAAENAVATSTRAGESAANTWLAIARAEREWAVANSHTYELIYGTPVPGYQAPQDTVRAATRIWLAIIDTLHRALDSGTLAPTGPEFPTERLIAPGVFELSRLGDVQSHESALMIARSFTLFTSLIGAISAELFGHYHGMTGDLPGVFDATIATAAAGVGLHISLVP
jgi:AcrR family transcriptional regulator